jgi:hypothetical protein
MPFFFCASSPLSLAYGSLSKLTFFLLTLLPYSYLFRSPSHLSLLYSSLPSRSNYVTYYASCASFCPLFLLIHNFRRIILIFFASEGINQSNSWNNILCKINRVLFKCCASREAFLYILSEPWHKLFFRFLLYDVCQKKPSVCVLPDT